MNTKIRPFTFCLTACFAGISFFGHIAHGAVIMVSPGQSVQSAVNSATSGDIIKILPGTYSGDLTINSKNITISGTANQFSDLSDLMIVDSNITLQQLRLSKLVLNDGASFTGNVIVNRCEIGTVDSNSSSLTIQYSKMGKLTIFKNAIVTACELDGNWQGGIGICIAGSQANALIQNSRIHSYALSATANIINNCIGIQIVGGAVANINNNLIHACKDTSPSGSETSSGRGIDVRAGSTAFIKGNILWDCFVAQHNGEANLGDALIYSAGSANISHNVLWKSSPNQSTNNNWKNVTGLGGDATGHNNLLGDPKFTNTSIWDYTLTSDSFAIDAGPPDPRYNDRDGSRNDIGMFGGHNFIPDGRTTNKPIVLGLDVAPIAVPTGGTVSIESTGATVK